MMGTTIATLLQLILLVLHGATNAFHVLPWHIKGNRQNMALQVAKRGTAGKGKSNSPSGKSNFPKSKTSNTKSSNRNSSSNSKPKQSSSSPSSSSSSSSESSRAAQFNQKRKQQPQSTQSPPWQVVSKKDMAKNIQAEKKRRELAQQQGIHNVKEVIDLRVSNSFLSVQDKALLAWKRFALAPQDEIDFIGAYLDKQIPPRLGAPEVAFLGRSNVGKSSLLNKLVGSELARVGKTPGATASVNMYGIFRKDNKALMGLVDLPGFGYAKLSKEVQESVQQAAENYLGKRKELMLGILLVDVRRVPSDDDRDVLAALFDMGVPIIVVATKVDKLSKNQLEEALRVIQMELGLPDGQPFCVSSYTGQGIKELWRIIMEACEGGVAELNAKMENGQNLDTALAAPIEYLDDDGDDMSYSQGFDWGEDAAAALYDDEYYDDDDDDNEEGDGEYVDWNDANDEDVMDMNNKKQSLKFLRQKAKDMERRGEL